MTEEDETMTQAPRISRAEFDRIVAGSLPLAAAWKVEVLEITYGHAELHVGYASDFLRPGGTISGPVQMGLADMAMFAAVMSAIGPVPGAVTSSLSINFLRKPGPTGMRAVARLLKLGRRLAVGEVELFSDGEEGIVAHVVATYALPAYPDTAPRTP
jgi:uncharacterized protein (TIGR00369 family)